MRVVPDTANFTLKDVLAVTGGTSLIDAYNNSTYTCFDPQYGHISGGVLYGRSLDKFRNYHVLEVGDVSGGGIITYIINNRFNDGTRTSQQLLVCAPSDSSSGIKWYNTNNSLGVYSGYDLSYSGSVFGRYAIIDGNSVTSESATSENISVQGNGSYAATNSRNYSYGGYSNWSLPTYYSLKTISNNISLLESKNPGFTATFSSNSKYWTCTEAGRDTGSAFSTEHTFDSALAIILPVDPIIDNPSDQNSEMFLHVYNKSNLFNVRPVRIFNGGYFS